MAASEALPAIVAVDELRRPPPWLGAGSEARRRGGRPTPEAGRATLKAASVYRRTDPSTQEQ